MSDDDVPFRNGNSLTDPHGLASRWIAEGPSFRRAAFSSLVRGLAEPGYGYKRKDKETDYYTLHVATPKLKFEVTPL